jgi:hypothetical protein
LQTKPPNQPIFAHFRMFTAAHHQYIDITYDVAFKHVMETDAVVIPLLNAILPQPVKSIKTRAVSVQSAPSTPTDSRPDYSLRPRSASVKGFTAVDKESFGWTKNEKDIRYDFVCETDTGELINVEMQRRLQNYYFHRAVYYASRLFSETVGVPESEKKNTWTYALKKVYHIAFVDFDFRKVFDIPLKCDRCWKIWSRFAVDWSLCSPVQNDPPTPHSDLMNVCLISLQNFKTLNPEVVADGPLLDKFTWLFANLGKTDKVMPAWTKERELEPIIQQMRILALNEAELATYELEKKARRDEHDIMLTATSESYQEGVQEGGHETAALGIQNLYNDGVAKEVAYRAFPKHPDLIENIYASK